MKIYTKKGDKGDTSLYGGKRISKSAPQVDAYGTIDELLAHIGYIRELPILTQQQELLTKIQRLLFTIGSILAADPEKQKLFLPELQLDDVTILEERIDAMNDHLEPQTHFVLPGGSQENASIHIARTVCRRAERKCVELAETLQIPTILITYLNRLSDYLFVLSRQVSKDLDTPETHWKPRKDES